jgi:hypothetical protein
MALVFGIGSAAAADWPSEMDAKIESAVANMLALDRPQSIGLVTVFDGNKFVQCRRQDDRAIRCEAAGALLQPSLARTLTSARIEALDAFGWTLDSSFGNYVQMFPADAAAKRLATEIETALSEAYAVDPERVEVRTDWVKKEPCPPRAGRSQDRAGSINDSRALAQGAIHACDYKPPTTGELRFTSGDVNELAAAYGARVTGELQRLRVNSERQVYFVLDSGIGFVQCAPQDKPPSQYCEAQSADSWPALASVLTPERVARLHALGYAEPGRSPNYERIYALDKYDDAAIARELLTVLHDVYGYRGTPKLQVVTEKGAD